SFDGVATFAPRMPARRQSGPHPQVVRHPAPLRLPTPNVTALPAPGPGQFDLSVAPVTSATKTWAASIIRISRPPLDLPLPRGALEHSMPTAPPRSAQTG